MFFLRLTILILLSILSIEIYAQRIEIGANGSVTGYMGDINTSSPLYFKNLGGGLFVKYNLDPTWGIKLSANHLLISGDDQDFDNDFQQIRNLKFKNQLTEAALSIDFNFLTYFDSRHKSKITPYLSAGLAVIKHNPYIYYDENKIYLRPLKLEYDANSNSQIYNNLNVAVPLGIGIKYRLNSEWSIGVEAKYRIAFTDYLDNISREYATSVPIDIVIPNATVGVDGERRPFDQNDWRYLADPSNNLSINAGTARGDGKRKDGYMTAGITLTYTIFDPNCYSWIKR
ncbi:MAG: DUF6089 family protein [Sphingobacterium composti]|uniref:type IX secretion system protein PorG n=1 Tax=Sphingobacterium composti TaxID=363260 RepID=UPI0021D206BA|nr:DUF6089 family protein [Sphingobacterium composti Ten et al. 2007 non Yoo et al. 2007]